MVDLKLIIKELFFCPTIYEEEEKLINEVFNDVALPQDPLSYLFLDANGYFHNLVFSKSA